MAFEVRCPDCRKLYSAEWRLVGKRIRCRQCAQVFTVGSPAQSSAPVVAGAAAVAAGAAGEAAADGSDTAAVVAVPPPPDDDPIAAAHFEEDRTALRSSRPQQFPGSQVLEAWLPLALGLIAVVWCASETFTENHTGKAWVPLLRMATIVGLYMLLIVPATLAAVRKRFAQMGRALPPSAMQRVAVTFALPVTLAYVFWLYSGGIPAVVTGLVLGVVLMAAVFWLLFRLDPEECASAYTWAGGTFLAATTVGVALLCGANFLLNRAMMASHSSSFKESPLGTALAWQIPTPPRAIPHPRPGRSIDGERAPDRSQTPDATSTEPPARSVATIPGRTSPPPDHGSVALPWPPPSPRATSPLATAPATDDAELDPAIDSELFGRGSKQLGTDSFVENIQQAKLPWVQRVYLPADEGVFEDSLAPITPSPYIGLVRLAGVSGKTIECCRLTPWFRGAGAVPMSQDGSDSPAFSGRCALSPDGKLLLRLTNNPAPKVELVPLRGAGRSIPLTAPNASGRSRAAHDDALLTPELLGVLPRQRFLVRWSRTGKWILQVYPLAGSDEKPSPITVPGEGDSTSVYAVSADGNWFATVVERADSSVVAVYSLTGSDSGPKTLRLTEIADPAQWEWSGLSFSPDGGKVAALLERDSDGIIRSWTIATGRPAASGTCKVPSADERLGHMRGRLFDCLAGNIWLASGRTLLDAASGRVLGTLTNEIVVAQQVADGHTVYLSYALGDGVRHVAVVKLDTELLNGPAAAHSPPGR